MFVHFVREDGVDLAIDKECIQRMEDLEGASRKTLMVWGDGSQVVIKGSVEENLKILSARPS